MINAKTAHDKVFSELESKRKKDEEKAKENEIKRNREYNERMEKERAMYNDMSYYDRLIRDAIKRNVYFVEIAYKNYFPGYVNMIKPETIKKLRKAGYKVEEIHADNGWYFQISW